MIVLQDRYFKYLDEYPEEKEWFDTKEVAAMLGFQPQAVVFRIHKGNLPHRRVKKAFFLQRDVVQEMIYTVNRPAWRMKWADFARKVRRKERSRKPQSLFECDQWGLDSSKLTPSPPSKPSKSWPGTQARIEAYRARLERGEDLWSEQDGTASFHAEVSG